MSILDTILGSSPTQLNLGTPAIDTSSAAINKALKDASTVPTVAKDTASAGVVMEGGTLGVEAQVDKSLGKDGKFGDVVGEVEDSKATGWKFGAWWKKSWGSK